MNFQVGPESRTFNGDLVNNGTINVNKDTGFNKSLNTVTNNGLLKVASSATLSITNGGMLTNNSGSTLTGGTYDIAGVFQMRAPVFKRIRRGLSSARKCFSYQ